MLDDEDEKPIVELEQEPESESELVQESESEPEPESEIESRAKQYGHLSKEEWEAQGKDPKQWKSPEEFDKTGKILEQLYSLRHQVDRRDREIQALVDYQQRTAQREYDRAKKEVENQLKISRDDMDVAGVEHYTKELVKIQEAEHYNANQAMHQQQQDALNKFKERNKHWFNDNNNDLVNRAIVLDQELRGRYPNMNYDDLCQTIEAKMLYEFPERVGNFNKPRPIMSSSQSSVNKTAKAPSSQSFNRLSQDLKDTYNATKRIIESRGDREYSVQDFMDQLKKDGEI